MGMALPVSSGIADALFSQAEQRVLALLFGQPDRSFQGAELIRMAGLGTGAVHRVLTRFVEAGLITVTRLGNQKHYRANPDSPVFAELRGLVQKTVGVFGPLEEALRPLEDRIRSAFVFGSVASGEDSATSDIDLMVIADGLMYADVYDVLQAAERVLHRPINPHVLSIREWKRKLRERNPFIAKVASRPKLFVIGSENALA